MAHVPNMVKPKDKLGISAHHSPMCNRYAFEDTVEALAAVFGARVVANDMDPSNTVLLVLRAPAAISQV